MNNLHQWVLQKTPIWMAVFFFIGVSAFHDGQLMAQLPSSVEIEDIHVEDLSVQAGKCYQTSAYYITQNYKHLFFKAPVPLTGNLNLVVSSDVDIALCALQENTPGTLTILPGSAQDNRIHLDTLKLTGLTPCDTVFYEIKSYDFKVGREVKVCLYEPALEVTCGTPIPFTDSDANPLTGSGATILGYKPNEHTATVICPDDPDKRFVSLTFNEFWIQEADTLTEKCLDYMQILDGNTPYAPPIEICGKTKFCGDDLQGQLVYATNWPSGCLTVLFHSNADSLVGSGWSATVDCQSCNINFKSKVTQSCVGNDRRIDISPTGGSGQYEYMLNGGPAQDVGTFYVSAAAFPVSVTVKDKHDHTCMFTQTITDESEPLSIVVDHITPTNCDGKNGSIIVKVLGGVEPYKFDLQGDPLTGGYINPIRITDSTFLFKGLTLTQFDPATGLPLSTLIEVEITDGNYCITDVQDQLYSSCEETKCGVDNLPIISTEKIAYYCAEDDDKKIILDTFSIGDAATGWLISDTAIVHIYEGQGNAGKLIASYSRANPPQPSDFPLFTKSSCITVFIANDKIGALDNTYSIKTSCADCDYTVDVVEYNADCDDKFGKAIIKIWGDSDYTVTLLESFPEQSWQLQGNASANGSQQLVVGGLIEGRYTFKIRENWFYCEQFITVDIGKNDGPSILDIEVTNETCDKQSVPNGTALITVAGGSGNYLYSIQGDAPGSDFYYTPIDGSTLDLDLRPDTVAFLITDLEGNGYLHQTTSYSLVVKDAYLTSSDCKDIGVIEVGDNCFNKKCGGTFFDAPADTHVMATDNPLSRENYNDTLPFVSVICPSIYNKFVTVDFDTFRLAVGDTLCVYDSTAVGTDGVLIDAYVGFGLNQKSVTATNATGCLTFEFKPNGDGNTEIGWFAEVECHQACDLRIDDLWIKKETCATSEDGEVRFTVWGGTNKKMYSLRPLGTPLSQATFQRDHFFTGLVEGEYIYTIKDDLIPNCELTDTIEIDRHPPITWTVKSPGLTCGASTSKVTIIPHGGSGQYKITPAGIEAHSQIINEGEEFTYTLTGAGWFQFKINDAANKVACYDKFTVEVNDNCIFSCYDNEQFSSNRPFDGTSVVIDSAGYRNYEHVEITYCSHYADKSIKADFQFFETELNLDVLSIYHGKGTAGPLVGHFSGTQNPGTIISTAADGCLTFAFETNLIDNNFDGFLADITCVSCKLNAKYKDIQGETFCWNNGGDVNGSIKVAVDYPVITDSYEFQLQDTLGNPLSPWKTDNNDDATFADQDDAADVTTTGIDDVYVFGGLIAGKYQVAVRSVEDTTCVISLQPVEIEEIDQLEVKVEITNANCDGEYGKVCITPLKGSGQYSFSDDNFSMFMNSACFKGYNGQTLTINVIDDITHCEVTVTATIGSDCNITCGTGFTDDAGWNGIPGDADDGSALYGKNIDTTWIFCPTHDDKLVEIDFTEFSTSVEDTLTIIDGDGYGYLIGHYSGANSPGLVRSSTGCLTVKFKSDEYIEKKGWKAKVGCFYCPHDLKLTHNVTNTCGYAGPIQLTATATGHTSFVYSLDGTNWNNTTGYYASIPTGTTKIYAKIPSMPNCIATVDMNFHAAMNMTMSSVKASCTANTGKITINGTGGSGSFTYLVNGTTIVGNSLSGLAAGSYVVRMIDQNHPACWDEKTIVVGKETCTPTTTCVSLKTFLCLEGAYNPKTGIMKTTLNDKGYLPGQKPNAFFGTPTIAGQPYNVAPWSYIGTEGTGYNHVTVGNNKAGYHTNVVDWVLISLRSGTAKSTTVCRHAALLYRDGSIKFADNHHDCCQLDPSKKYYVVVEHRNHLMVMSHAPMPVVGGSITYDFRNKDSYKALFGVGQKHLGGGKYAMYCGNGDQTTSSSADTNITTDDKNKWVQKNGSNSAYYYSDFDMNGDVNVTDKSVWLDNNGKACDVPNN